MRLPLARLAISLVLLLASCGTATTGPLDPAPTTAQPPSTTTPHPPPNAPEEAVTGPEDPPAPDQVLAPDSGDGGADERDQAERPPASLPEPVPASDGPEAGGEVPDGFLTEVMGEAATRLGVDPAGFTIIRAESVVWNDGALGCPEPGVVYSQATVPGYWIVLEYGTVELDYRTRGVSYYTPCPASAQTGAGELPDRCANC